MIFGGMNGKLASENFFWKWISRWRRKWRNGYSKLSLIAIEIFWKRIIKKPPKSLLYFFFRTESLLMDKVIKNKRAMELVTSRYSGYKTSSKNSFISYILSDQVWWYNIERFLSYFKNYNCKFMQVNSWHHKLFHFHLSFWIW